MSCLIWEWSTNAGYKGGMITASHEADAYIVNGIFESCTIKQTAQTARVLPKSVITTIPDIASREKSEMCLGNDLFNQFESTTVKEIMSLEDCCPFAKFLFASSLKSATNFMKGDPQYGDVLQLNTIHRCHYQFSFIHFKPMQPTVVSALFQNAIYALVKEKKFLSISKMTRGRLKWKLLVTTCWGRQWWMQNWTRTKTKRKASLNPCYRRFTFIFSQELSF